MKTATLFIATALGATVLCAQNPLTTELKMQYEGSKANLVKSAERLPDADYSSKPAAGNTRTFGQLIGHVADVQMAICGAVKGERKMGDTEKTKTSKADIVAALNESFAYCDGAYDGLTDASGTEMIKMFGGERSKLGALYFNLIHNSEMYGEVVVYYRAKGMVPPSTADRGNMGKKKE
jgi:uncharacterized damage-inducible protein DinB